MTHVYGVGEITALSYLLTLASPPHFAKSRQVGAFLGLMAGQRQSGEHDPRASLRRRRRAAMMGERFTTRSCG